MENFKRYEELMEEFSYKSYQYAGDTIKIGIIECSDTPRFVMKSPELESKLDEKKKSELNTILVKAMDEVMKYKETNKSVKSYLGWN